MGERKRGGLEGGGGSQKERGIKIFSEENEVMTKYPPGACRAEGVSGKDCLGKGKANVSKEKSVGTLSAVMSQSAGHSKEEGKGPKNPY